MSPCVETRTVQVPNPQGLHARPAALIIRTASQFAADITIKNPATDVLVDAKLMLEVMMLTAPAGTELVVSAEGDDAAEAVEAVARLVEDGFGEM